MMLNFSKSPSVKARIEISTPKLLLSLIMLSSIHVLHTGESNPPVTFSTKKNPVLLLNFGHSLQVLKSIKSITEDQAIEWLKDDLVEAENQLNKLNLNLKQYEFDALISFIFNCGFRNFEQSRLLRMVKTRIGDVENAFSLWNKSNGKVLPGLVARRKSEWTLFSTGKLEFFN